MKALQHKGIVHRDLKPQNILLSHAGKPNPQPNDIRLKIGEWPDYRDSATISVPPGQVTRLTIYFLSLFVWLSSSSGFRVRPVPSRRCHGSHALWVSYVHGTISCVTGIVVVPHSLSLCPFVSLISLPWRISFLFLFKGSWGYHVPSIWCQSGSVEFRYNSVPMSDGTGALHSSDASSFENVLRKES